MEKKKGLMKVFDPSLPKKVIWREVMKTIQDSWRFRPPPPPAPRNGVMNAFLRGSWRPVSASNLGFQSSEQSP